MNGLGGRPGGISHDLPEDLWERALLGPAREVLRRPGKEFRARVVKLSWTLAGGECNALPRELPALVEILHAGSLIIDDVEDGSEERRGARALHRLFGVPLAINTGNWMYFWAFHLLGQAGLDESAGYALYRRLSRTLMRCHEGQALDLAVHVAELEQARVPEVVTAITTLKTGNLMEFAGYLGARAAGGSEVLVRRIARFARDIGVGLQMLDDLGCIAAGTRSQKGLEDLRNGRSTWPWAWVAEAAEPSVFSDLQVQLNLAATDEDLRDIALSLRARCEAIGRSAVANHLADALTALHREVGSSPLLAEIEEEIERLTNSYG